MPTVCLHSLLYLLPSAVIAFLLSRLAGRVYLFAVLTLPGTLAHELLHWLIGAIVGAKPTSLSILPRRGRGREYTLGAVSFANLRWYNAAPAALAPILILPLVGAAAFWRVHVGWHFAPLDIAIWLGLGPLLLSFWPSNADWALAWRSWPVAVIVAATAAGYWSAFH